LLDDPAPFVPFTMSKRGKQADFATKTVMLAGRRYIVCRNHQQAEKDAADRASILAALERQLAKGDKSAKITSRSIPTGRGGEEVRWHLRAAYQHRSQPARSHALLQAIVNCGANLPNRQAPALDPANLPQARRDHPRPRVL
jgi:hypothetical protein